MIVNWLQWRGLPVGGYTAVVDECGGAIDAWLGGGLVEEFVHQARPCLALAWAVHRSIKRAIDPHGILNPGKWLD